LSHRPAALVAALLVALLAISVVVGEGASTPTNDSAAATEGQVLAASAPNVDPRDDRVPLLSPAPSQEPGYPVVTGTASNYQGTAGFGGEAVVALPGAMGGRYTGAIQGWATVCADRCARLPVVDWCQCYWGTADRRVADISHAAWPLITNKPLSAGLVRVRVILDDPHLAAVWGAA
jgi:hypothetical protein